MTAQILAGDNVISMHAVAYIRTEASEASSEQRRAIEAWAAREAIEIRDWQVDAGVDATTPIAERPGLLAAYQAIRHTGAGILVAANAERFSHDELVGWLIERAALGVGAAVHTADGSRVARRPEESAEAHRAYTRGAIDLARAYKRVMMRARVREVLAEKKMRGQRVGNVRFGYRVASDGVRLELDEKEQAILACVRELSLEGRTQREIAEQLAARGMVGRTGAPFRQQQISMLLRAAG